MGFECLVKPPFEKVKRRFFQQILDKKSGKVYNIITEKNATNVVIDSFTPCLQNAMNGEIVPTGFSVADKTELQNLSGWNFNWLGDDLKVSKYTFEDG